jgi:hypothetical protein
MPRRPASPPCKSKPIPFSFLLEALAPLQPEVRPMFGGHCVYIGDKAVFMLRDKPITPGNPQPDNGVWLIFEDIFDTSSDPAALHHQFPSLRAIQLLEGKIKHWLVLPTDAPDFESSTLHACDLLLAHDPRLGRIPASRR